MQINQRNIDLLDVPNQQSGDRLPDYKSTMRRPDRTDRAPRWLWLATIIAVSIVALALIALLWPALRALGDLFIGSLLADQQFTALVMKGLFVLVSVGIVSIPFAYVYKMRRNAETAGIIRLANDMPVDVRHIKHGWTLDAMLQSITPFYETQNTWAAHSDHRNMNTYGPSTHFSNRQDGIAPVESLPMLPEALTYDKGQTVLEQMKANGHICRSGNSLTVGHDEMRQPQTIEMRDCSFVAIGGQPRVGKTTTAKFLLAQAAMMGWHVALCDPHGLQEQGLLSLCEPISGAFIRQAVEPTEIVEAINFIDKIGRRRINNLDAIDKPILLVIDEFTSLVLRSVIPDDVLAKLTAMIVEYSKVGVHGCIIGHDWTGKLLGPIGAPLRRAITHRIVHRSDVQNAEFLLSNAALAKQANNLPKGQALYWGTDSPVLLAIPPIAYEDMRYAGRGLAVKPYQPRNVAPALPGTQAALSLPAGQPKTTDVLAPMTQRQIIIDLLTHHGPMNALEIAGKTGIDRDVVFKLVGEMTKARQIKRTGEQRNYSYSI